MKENINKISIIGGCGTGKTTLANNLGKELKDVYYELFPSNKKSDDTK